METADTFGRLRSEDAVRLRFLLQMMCFSLNGLQRLGANRFGEATDDNSSTTKAPDF